MGGAAGGAEALIVDRCAHDQEVAAGETSHPALITYTNLIDSDHMSYGQFITTYPRPLAVPYKKGYDIAFPCDPTLYPTSLGFDHFDLGASWW